MVNHYTNRIPNFDYIQMAGESHFKGLLRRAYPIKFWKYINNMVIEVVDTFIYMNQVWP